MSVIKIDRKGIPDAAKNVILSDIRRFLSDDCEYYWDEKTEMLSEEQPDGELFKMNFALICERVKAIKIKPKEANV